MNDNILKYKGYTTTIEFSVADKVLYGKIEGIDDLVSFYSEQADSIETEFHTAVDNYLALCEKIGKKPNKEYSGTFNVRIEPELHKQISLEASHNHRSLNAEVESAIEYYLANKEQSIQYRFPTVLHTDQIITSNVGWKGRNINEYSFQGTGKVVNTLH